MRRGSSSSGHGTAGIVAILLGALLVFFRFPRKEDEQRLLAAYAAEDTQPAAPTVADRPSTDDALRSAT